MRKHKIEIEVELPDGVEPVRAVRIGFGEWIGNDLRREAIHIQTRPVWTPPPSMAKGLYVYPRKQKWYASEEEPDPQDSNGWESPFELNASCFVGFTPPPERRVYRVK